MNEDIEKRQCARPPLFLSLIFSHIQSGTEIRGTVTGGVAFVWCV